MQSTFTRRIPSSRCRLTARSLTWSFLTVEPVLWCRLCGPFQVRVITESSVKRRRNRKFSQLLEEDKLRYESHLTGIQRTEKGKMQNTLSSWPFLRGALPRRENCGLRGEDEAQKSVWIHGTLRKDGRELIWWRLGCGSMGNIFAAQHHTHHHTRTSQCRVCIELCGIFQHFLACVRDSRVSSQGPAKMRKLLLALRSWATTRTESQALTWKLLPQAVMKRKHFFIPNAAASRDRGRATGPKGSQGQKPATTTVCLCAPNQSGQVSTPTFPMHSTARSTGGSSEDEDNPSSQCHKFPKLPVLPHCLGLQHSRLKTSEKDSVAQAEER